MAKEKKVIKEAEDDLHFVLPIKLIPHVDSTETKTPVAEDDEEKKDEPVVEDEEVKDDEVKTEGEEDDIPVDVTKTEDVDAKGDDVVDSLQEDEEEKKDEPAVAEGDEEHKDEPVAEDEEKEEEPAVTEDEEEKEYKLSEDLGDLQLEQDVKDKIDAAFDTIVKEKVARIREELEAGAEKQVKEAVEKLQASVALYCEKVARSFIAQNRLALKESLRLKYFESFFGKVRKLFKENYVDLPESEEDLAKELKAENEELKDKQDELLKDNEKLAESVVRLQRQIKIDKVAADMFLTESERFKTATEKLLSEKKLSDKRFDEKLKAISELFSNKKPASTKKKLLSEGKIEKSDAPATGTDAIHPDVKAILSDW